MSYIIFFVKDLKVTKGVPYFHFENPLSHIKLFFVHCMCLLYKSE